ncbi:ATP-binding protein [Streptomyces sp. NPDC047971]|uniref:ATP-binding protein n=1 Tax=Streptomyces sp. NPDC047971 TaxID=3154499 RepID=UPI0033FC8418
MRNANTPERAASEPRLSASAVYDAADGGAIASARAFTTDFLASVRTVRGEPVPDDRADLARLVVSELVTNAVRHAPGPCRLLLDVRRNVLEISVIDGTSAAPVPRAHDPRRIGQHGVEIIVAVCESVTVEPHPDGKRVLARLPLIPSRAGGAAGARVRERTPAEPA